VLLEHPPFLGGHLHRRPLLQVRARGPWTIRIVSTQSDDLASGTTLINEIGPYGAERVIPPGTKVIVIRAPGDWTTTRRT
jgi:hypothetical protein